MSLHILYVYPEEWTGTRAREIQTLQTCLALADAGAEVDLVTAGGWVDRHARGLGRDRLPRSLRVTPLSRRLGPFRSAHIFARHLVRWLPSSGPFTLAYVIHPKAAAMMATLGIPYWYEAHEVFAESRTSGTPGEVEMERDERNAVAQAAGRIATSAPLAEALNARYFAARPLPFEIVPNAGEPPVPRTLAEPTGPLVYAGSLDDWKGVGLALEAAARLGWPLRLVGGDQRDWNRLARSLDLRGRAIASWRPRVAARDLLEAITGCRAGLVPTLPDTGSGRYSCPMKLFDYARCGLPVVTTDLPSLASLAPGAWCVRVAEPTVEAWAAAFSRIPAAGAEALAWAATHTWSHRATELIALFSRPILPP
jgi:teichuronic acid biosynthesis glycosyltransferase TuaH